jgi:hypothetical protein
VQLAVQGTTEERVEANSEAEAKQLAIEEARLSLDHANARVIDIQVEGDDE